MPTYEYECTNCKYRFEIFQGIKEAPHKFCPKCGSSLKRLIGKGAGIIFKGSGFYATDYRKGKPPKEETSQNICCHSQDKKGEKD
ncbi:MAG: zinc ribbon domain-containing protein [Candidatus Omnitrophica bacterium]|nr:zinc ribbon domain-containing protein [Candidatus Omnitrophota bacterium]